MKRLVHLIVWLAGAGVLGLGISVSAANLPAGWLHEQSFAVTNAGLVKIRLPVATLEAARPAQEDLRIYDDAGNDVPYVINHPLPVAQTTLAAKSFEASLTAATTVITLGTGLDRPVDGVTLETPALSFIKAVRVEGSTDGHAWGLLAQGQPIFRQLYGASHLTIALPPGLVAWLRITVDDQRSPPIPITGAELHATRGEPAPLEWLPVAISERDENPGETRLALSLGAANLDIAAVQWQTAQPLFMRQVALAIPHHNGESVTEQTIAEGAVYRVAVGGQAAAEKLAVPLEQVVPTRELYVFITNGDSPPLTVSSVKIARRPVYLIFLAAQPGTFQVLTGNAECAAPRYDLAALNLDVKSVAVTPVTLTPPAENPAYRAPEVLPGLAVTGAALDSKNWSFRKPVKAGRGGALQIELDPAVLAHARGDLADLRLGQGRNQVPYIIQRTSIHRSLALAVTAVPDAKNPRWSRWTLQLPEANLPVTRLTGVVRTPLFERTFSLYENLADERGGSYRQELGGGTWRQTPDQPGSGFSLGLNGRAESGTLWLETDNGDNPPIDLAGVTAFYPVTRLLCQVPAEAGLYLYYGNARADLPSYDLSLVADELLAAEKQNATLGAEERLKPVAWAANPTPGKGGVGFWGVLAVVIAGLLAIISRLLPKAAG